MENKLNLNLVYLEHFPDLEAIHQLGEGWVAEEALAIAGNILGAYLGYDNIPRKYTENLEMMDVMERIAGELMLH